MKIKIYTDGACSKNPGPGGWAVVIALSEKLLPFSGNEPVTTNNAMELTAVINALKQIINLEKKGYEKADYEINSDSAYVINAINKGWLANWKINGWKTSRNEPVKNRELWNEFIKYIDYCTEKEITVKFKKVKGHSGDIINEMVDKMAVVESQRIQEKW